MQGFYLYWSSLLSKRYQWAYFSLHCIAYATASCIHLKITDILLIILFYPLRLESLNHLFHVSFCWDNVKIPCLPGGLPMTRNTFVNDILFPLVSWNWNLFIYLRGPCTNTGFPVCFQSAVVHDTKLQQRRFHEFKFIFLSCTMQWKDHYHWR